MEIQDKVTTKALIIDICSQGSRVKKMRTELNKYSKIIDYLLEKKYNDENVQFPLIKDLVKSIGVPYSNFRKHLESIFEILLKEENCIKYPFIINEEEVWLNFTSKRNREFRFMVKGMTTIPRKGEQMDIPFLSANQRFGTYYIKEIYSEFSDQTHIINIYLNQDTYSPYLHLRLDQASKLGEISFWDGFNKSDNELLEILQLDKRKAW